jgi:hypothetical protein
MTLVMPNLDDRTFAQLVEGARQRIRLTSSEWTDLSVSDPGMVLVEVFAFLTETMIYRLNRLPEKAYIAFLRLLGLYLLPAEAASAKLVFRLPHPGQKAVEIPRGTRVTVSRAESGSTPPIFVVLQPAVIPAGKDEVEVLAHHCELVDAELLGRGSGAPGLTVSVSRPPIVAATEDSLDLVVAVEAKREELEERAPAREFAGKLYRVWREVENFTQLGPDPYVYMVDRTSGLIIFAPAARMREESGSLQEIPQALAAVPAAEREIRAWYSCGGGPDGNVAANTLTVLKDAIPSVAVTNPAAAVGGRSAETLENALVRGPQELHSLQRAVTAQDFELAATRFGAVSRARAITKAALWTYALSGTVQLILVPSVEEQKRAGRVSAAQLQALQTEEARQKIQTALDERRPMGTNLGVSWARYKEAKVRARIVAHQEEDLVALKKRVLDRLYETINPLPTKTHSGWRFGQALRVSNVYDAALSEAGVNYVEDAQFVVEDVPENQVVCLAMDAFQPQTWYAGSQSKLYRSMDDADGWAPVGQFAGQAVYSIQAHPGVPGLVAVATRDEGGAAGSRLYVSWDCGESWQQRALTAFNVVDMAWAFRDGAPLLLLATSVGLFELPIKGDAGYVQVFVRADDQQIGYYAVAATGGKDGFAVAVASQKKGGVFLSSDSGKGNTFRNIGMAGEDVRVLAVQYDGPRAVLWAGLAAQSAGDPGKGCFAWDPMGPQDPPNGWQAFDRGWLGGSCVELAFQGSKILAGTYDAGVLWLEKRSDQESWHAPDINCGLPQVSREHPLERVDALAADPRRGVLLTGGKSGVFRSRDGGQTYEACSRKVFADKVALDPNWLFCSGEHEIEVVTESEKGTD